MPFSQSIKPLALVGDVGLVGLIGLVGAVEGGVAGPEVLDMTVLHSLSMSVDGALIARTVLPDNNNNDNNINHAHRQDLKVPGELSSDHGGVPSLWGV